MLCSCSFRMSYALFITLYIIKQFMITYISTLNKNSKNKVITMKHSKRKEKVLKSISVFQEFSSDAQY